MYTLVHPPSAHCDDDPTRVTTTAPQLGENRFCPLQHNSPGVSQAVTLDRAVVTK